MVTVPLSLSCRGGPLKSGDHSALDGDEIIGTGSYTARRAAIRLNTDEDVRTPIAVEHLGHAEPPVVAPDLDRPVIVVQQQPHAVGENDSLRRPM
jgi:hypothetical protein